MPWDLPYVPDDEVAWERLKKTLWAPLPDDRKVYINDPDFTCCIKRSDGNIEVCSFFYGHYGKLAKEYYFDEYAKDFENAALSKWNSHSISIIVNFSLGGLVPHRITSLPKSVKYYNNDRQLSRINLDEMLELSYLNHRELAPGYRITSISYRKGGYVGEDSIMRGLANGDGDLFGL